MQRTMKGWRHLNPHDLCHSYPLTWYFPTRCLSTAERSKDSPPKSTQITPGCLIIKCLIHMWNRKAFLCPWSMKSVFVSNTKNVSLSFSKNCFWTLGTGNNAPCTNAQNRAALADANPCFGRRSRHSMSMACTRGQHKAVVFKKQYRIESTKMMGLGCVMLGVVLSDVETFGLVWSLKNQLFILFLCLLKVLTHVLVLIKMLWALLVFKNGKQSIELSNQMHAIEKLKKT